MESPLENPLGYSLTNFLKDINQGEEYILGIDEAGRGPVLGPMVYAAAFCPLALNSKLGKMGFVDSKTVKKHENRLMLFEKLRNAKEIPIGWVIRILDPEYLSNLMLALNRESLNVISHNCIMEMIQAALDNGVKVKEVYVDTVGPPKKLEDKLNEAFPNVTCVVSKKADSIYPIVSAASICAKVTRDLSLEHWVFKETNIEELSHEFGCGYPSDAVTKQWLRVNVDKVFGYPSVVRFSWKTTILALNKGAIKVEWETDKEKLSENYSTQRFRYFVDNQIETVHEI